MCTRNHDIKHFRSSKLLQRHDVKRTNRDRSRHFPEWTAVRGQMLKRPRRPTIGDSGTAILALRGLLLPIPTDRLRQLFVVSCCWMSSLLLLSAGDQLYHSALSLKTGWLREKLRAACQPDPCRARLSSPGQSTAATRYKLSYRCIIIG